MEFTERTGPDPMDTLIEELEARTEGTVSGDNEEGVVTIWGVRDGARADVSTLEIDGQIMHTLKLV